MSALLEWTDYPSAGRHQAPLSCSGHYVISHRPSEYNLCFRPPNEHHFVGVFKTLGEAKAAGSAHASAVSK